MIPWFVFLRLACALALIWASVDALRIGMILGVERSKQPRLFWVYWSAAVFLGLVFLGMAAVGVILGS